MKRRAFLVASVPALLAACGADNNWAPDDRVRAARYVSPEPPSVTLLTVIGIPRGDGGHTALLINGSQRVIYDPAGSWMHPNLPERHDVWYGITDEIKNFYIDYHTRSNYWVAEDRLPVTREVADIAIRRVEAQGPANKSFCAIESSRALQGVPGFETAPVAWSPLRLRRWFLAQPGVLTREWRDGDPRLVHSVRIQRKDGSFTGQAGAQPAM